MRFETLGFQAILFKGLFLRCLVIHGKHGSNSFMPPAKRGRHCHLICDFRQAMTSLGLHRSIAKAPSCSYICASDTLWLTDQLT